MKAYAALGDMSVRTRLGAGFAVMLAIMAVMFVVAMSGLHGVDDINQDIAAKAWRAGDAVQDGDDARALAEASAPLKRLIAAQNARMERQVADGAAQVDRTRNLLLALGAVAVVAGVVLTIALVRGIVAPLGEAILIAETVAAGDLSQEFESTRGGEFGRLLRGMGEMEDTLTELVTRIKASTDSISEASKQIAVGNTDLSQRTEEQAATLQETASSMSELTATVKQNAERARAANSLAANASGIASRGGAVVGQVVETMDQITSASKKVVDIISVIEGIAFQTNILALNAAVEAARAGEQGRGFAVVAGEVRSLAQRSATAAKEIKTLIDDSVRQVESGSGLVAEAGATMQEIVEAVQHVTGILGEISDASMHQSTGIEQVTQAVMQMDAVTQQNASLVEQAAAASAALAEQTGQLQQAVGEFKLDTDPVAGAAGQVAGAARVAWAG